MQRWNSKREIMGDDPPYLAVGTEVSAKYKGAFCEAKVRKIVRSVKCKVVYKQGLGTATVTDDQIKGTLRAGATVEVRHSEKKEYVEAMITKIQDCSQYTVVFDDGDITTLRRTALCLKSGRHFAESETLDQLPLTHPEHFGNPVIGGRRGRRNRPDDSSDEEEPVHKGKRHKEEKEADIGKVVCVEISEKKKQKDNWFPGLVVAPTAQDTVRIHVREDYLVRSFKDGRYYTVPKKEATPFTREIGLKVDNNTLRIAVEKALLFLDKDELPPHWDRELLFGLDESSGSDSDAPFDSDTSDDEPREEKDHFVAQLYKFMDDRGTPINKGPIISGRDVDLYKLFKVVHKLGGYNRVTNHNQWKTVSHKLGFGQNGTTVNLVKHAYKKFLHSFEDFYRKLGCTMVNHPRGQRSRHRSNRSLIRDKDKTTSVLKEKHSEKDSEDMKEMPLIEIKKEESIKEEEKKIKEIVTEPIKTTKDSKKEIQRARTIKDDKSEKRDEKIIPSSSKVIDSLTFKVKDEKAKIDDREERIKMREMLKMDIGITGSNESKQDINYGKSVKLDDSHKAVKLTKKEFRDIKKDEKDSEVKAKKQVVCATLSSNISNEIEIKNNTETSNDTAKKPRSIFSRLTGSKKPKPSTNKLARTNNKQMGINVVRQKRSFTERMKAIVKRFKMKKPVKPEMKSSFPLNTPPILSPQVDGSDDDKKKKQVSSLEDEKKKKSLLLEEEKKKKTLCNSDKEEEKKKKLSSDKDEDKKKQRLATEEQEKMVPQLTRSKSKEDGLCLIKTKGKIDHPQQENKADKKSNPFHMINTSGPVNESDKKRGRKRKDTEREEKLSGNDEVLDLLPSYKTVSVGDKLRVYYGPTHESKVTYEAKVLNRKEEGNEVMYLVHYTGWNTRYDEWIKRNRIADNLSWNPGRAKRVRQPQKTQSRNGNKSKRSESVSGGARSTTPSSVTSSSSRTKSPAVNHPVSRKTRNRTQTRRISGHTDLSDSEIDEDFNSESDNESVTHIKQGSITGNEICDEDDFRKTDSEEVPKENNETKISIENIEERFKVMNSNDDINQDNLLGRMRSRSYRRNQESKPQIDDSCDKDDTGDNVSEIIFDSRGKKIKEEIDDLEDSPRDRIRSRSEKRKAEEIVKSQPLNPDEIQKESSDEPLKSDGLRSRDKHKLVEIKVEYDFETDRESSVKINRNDKNCSERTKIISSTVDVVDESTKPDPRRNIKTAEIEGGNNDLTNDATYSKKKGKSKIEDVYSRDVNLMKLENEDEPSKERRRSRRVAPKKDDSLKIGKEDDEEPKGRDFDLNQIRSELKGIDKAVNLPIEVLPKKELESENKKTLLLDKKKKEDSDNNPIVKSMNTTAEDIYEFKEPEPFEFVEEKGIKQLRTFGRISEDTINKSPVRRKVIKPKPENSDIKRRYRQFIKRNEFGTVDETKTSNNTSCADVSDNIQLENSVMTKVVKEPCEEAFDKLVETPSFREVLTSAKVDNFIKQSFTELPGEGDPITIDEDSEGRLVISEKEVDNEIGEPLVGNQQRDNENIFPKIICEKSFPSESIKEPSCSFFDSPIIVEIKEDEKSKVKDDDKDESSVVSILQRIPSQETINKDSNEEDNCLHISSLPNIVTQSESSQNKKYTPCTELKDNQKSDVDISQIKDNVIDTSSIQLKMNSDKNKVDNLKVIPNDSLNCIGELLINERDGNSLEKNILEKRNKSEEVIQRNDNNRNLDKIKIEGEINEDCSNQLEIKQEKSETVETIFEEIEESSEQSEKGGYSDQDGNNVDDKNDENLGSEIPQELEILTEKALILETSDIENEVVLEEIKEELILEEQCPEVEELQEEEVLEEKINTKEIKEDRTLGEEVIENNNSEKEKIEIEEAENNFQSLLCEETIPGSPAPVTNNLTEPENAECGTHCTAELPFASAPVSSFPHYKPPAPSPSAIPFPPPLPPAPLPEPVLPIINEAAPVMDNTPPTTPESSLSPISNSPRGDRSGSSPVPDNESSKSQRDSSEVDIDMYPEVTKIGHYSEEDVVCEGTTQMKKPPINVEDGNSQLGKKRRRSHRRSEDGKRPKIPQRSPRHNAGSESDDTSENSLDLLSTHSRSPKPSKFNFYVQLDPELDGSQRIAVLQQKLAELRKTYSSLKTELACIDRRRKKLRRRDREEKSLKPELSCS